VAGNPKFMFTAKLGRRFTQERVLTPSVIAQFQEGLVPLLRRGKLGALLMQFPWTFRYTQENREFLISLRRAFHEFPLVVEVRHASWMLEEALGTLIDYRIGFCNIDQAKYTSAMPPTALFIARRICAASRAESQEGNPGQSWLPIHGSEPDGVDKPHRTPPRTRRANVCYRGQQCRSEIAGQCLTVIADAR